MANITLADYVGYIFSEITRARDHADRVAKELALEYAKDEILKSFSVPRFKIPEMELTIPVIISGAKFSTAMVFIMQPDAFKNFINNKLTNAMRAIIIKKGNLKTDITGIKGDIFTKGVFNKATLTGLTGIKPLMGGISKASVKKSGKPSNVPMPERSADLGDPVLNEFYEQLQNSTDPGHPENIIQVKWTALFLKKIEDQGLLPDYQKFYPGNELYLETLKDVTDTIKANTIVSATRIDNLLVNPETNAVKTEGTDTTIFTIKAKIMEEGLFIKTMRDQETGVETQVVEFE